MLRRQASDFLRAHQGAIAVEFALAFGPFCILLITVLEIAANLMFFQQVDRAAQAAASAFRSGQIVASSYTADEFRNAFLCPKVSLIRCDKLQINLVDSAAGRRLVASDASGAVWCPGSAQDGRMLQLAYPVPLLSRLWAGALVENRPFYVATVGFRNPPDAAGGSC